MCISYQGFSCIFFKIEIIESNCFKIFINFIFSQIQPHICFKEAQDLRFFSLKMKLLSNLEESPGLFLNSKELPNNIQQKSPIFAH